MPAEAGIHMSDNRAADGWVPGLRRDDEGAQWSAELPARTTCAKSASVRSS